MITEEQALLLDLWDLERGEPEPKDVETSAAENLRLYLEREGLIDEDGNSGPEPELKFVSVDGGSVLRWEVSRLLEMEAKKVEPAVSHLLVILNMVLQMYVLSMTVGDGERGTKLLSYLSRWVRDTGEHK